jgi:hypothetical protein
VVGPPSWPTAYEDIIGFTLWPQTYGERLRHHGIGDVLAAILSPPTPVAALARTNVATNNPIETAGTGGCGSAYQLRADWPAADIERALQLTDMQQTALDQFKASIGAAIAAIKASCRDDAEMSPVERISAMQNTLWAVRDGAVLIRAPLARFYDSLTEDQQREFVIAASPPAPSLPPRVDRRQIARDMARMCGVPPQTNASMRQLERELHPTASQRASLHILQKRSFEMGQFMMASCLQPIPTTPAARLDAAVDRLTAVIFAAAQVGVALNDFYNQLDGQQQSRFKFYGRQSDDTPHMPNRTVRSLPAVRLR